MADYNITINVYLPLSELEINPSVENDLDQNLEVRKIITGEKNL